MRDLHTCLVMVIMFIWCLQCWAGSSTANWVSVASSRLCKEFNISRAGFRRRRISSRARRQNGGKVVDCVTSVFVDISVRVTTWVKLCFLPSVLILKWLGSLVVWVFESNHTGPGCYYHSLYAYVCGRDTRVYVPLLPSCMIRYCSKGSDALLRLQR